MSFIKFCDDANEVDQQTVTTTDSFVISFGKPGGSAHTIEPNDVVKFLKFFSANHAKYKKAIEEKQGSGKTYLKYDQDPYRTLYKLVGEQDDIKSIVSLGSSQTKELTKLISRFLTYVAGLEYKNVDEMTHFDLHSINKAIENIPENLKDLVRENTKTQNKLQLSVLPKPFVLLSGIPGTGKTRFVREQAEAHNVGDTNFCTVPVRPDWSQPSDLLGYLSRSGNKPTYISTKIIEFVIQAWRAIAPKANRNGHGALDFTSAPYWLCLAEMNLAPVEQYFADYLSALESRKYVNEKYNCDPLLDKFILGTKGATICSDLGLNNDEGLWDYFLNHGLSIPPNLIVVGTVSMGEATNLPSRKVIDRALTIDFGEFYPNDLSELFSTQYKAKIFSYGMFSQITLKEMSNCAADHDGKKSIAFLETINVVLKNTPFELAFRALNELLLNVSIVAPQEDKGLQAVWDDFLMTKVLPRINGDDYKLRIIIDESNENLLDKLGEVVAEQLCEIWEGTVRQDFFREYLDGSEVKISCRSRRKIQWMKDRLDRVAFTSYWA